VSPAENSKPPSGGTITADRCLANIRDAAHSESFLVRNLFYNNTFVDVLFCRDTHRKITHVICHVGFVGDYLHYW